ncbi:MAG: hypothetical protein AAGK32_01875, partial [Actinomycetota bacterium]
MRPAALSAALVGTATVALLSTLPLAGTRSRARLIGPHLRSATTGPPRSAVRDLDRPLALLGARIAVLLETVAGVTEPLGVRLDRVHAGTTAVGVRFRQGAIFLTLLALAGAVAVTLTPRPAVGAAVLIVVPLLGALVPEVEATVRARRWSESVRTELPVVGEELVARLSSGQSATAAIAAMGRPGGSPLRRDLERVAAHLRHGGGLDESLRAWAGV